MTLGRRSALGCSALLLLGLVLPCAAGAADVRDRTIKVGIGLNADHPQGQAVRRFGEIVAQNSGGKLKVRLFADGSTILRAIAAVVAPLSGGERHAVLSGTAERIYRI